MPGTGGAYQGFQLLRVQFRRSVGVEADISTVDLLVDDVHNLRSVDGATDQRLALLSVLRGGAALELSSPAQRREEGIFELAEVTRDGEEFDVLAPGLHVVGVERIAIYRTEQRWGIVTISLADDRGLWDRGASDRYQYLRPDAAGAPEGRDLDPVTGRPWTLAGVARDLVSNLYRGPALSRYPARWDALPGTFEFRPGTRPRAALRLFLEQNRARCVLELDRSVSLWGEGEARSATGILDRKGRTLKPDYIEDLGGQGHRSGQAFRRPPTQAVVVGGLRIHTVEVELEPVVLVNGSPVPLALGLEELRRRSGRPQPGGVGALPGARGVPAVLPRPDTGELSPPLLAYVRRMALRPEVLDASTEEWLQAIARDAYRLWRIVGADTFNRHLLPIENRAERKGDLRLSPEVIAATFTRRSGPVRRNVTTGRTVAVAPDRVADQARAAFLEAEAALAVEFGRIARRFHVVFVASGAIENPRLSPGDAAAAAALGRAPADTSPFFFLDDFINRMPDEPQLFVRDVGTGVKLTLDKVLVEATNERPAAAELLREGAAMLEADAMLIALEQRGGTRDLQGDIKAAFNAARAAVVAADTSGRKGAALKAAQGAVKFGTLSRTTGGFPTTNGAVAHPDLDALVRSILTDVEAIQRYNLLTPAERNAGALPEGIYYTNDAPHAVDAYVEDAELGTFRSRAALGHLDRTDTDTVIGRVLVPQKALARFGTRVRKPRIVPATQEQLATQTGASRQASLEDAGRQDVEHFRRTYQVAGVDGGRLRVTTIPFEQRDRDEIVSIERRDIGPELIELGGKTNAVELERKAEAAALEALDVPRRTEQAVYTYLRPRDVPLDGVVSGVEIEGRPGSGHELQGFRTRVTVGRAGAPFAGGAGTRARVAGDAAGEGINAPATGPGAP